MRATVAGTGLALLFAASGCGFQLSVSHDAATDDASELVVDAPDDAAIDAADPMIDAPPLDGGSTLVCPSSYNITIASTVSRYRFKKSGARARDSAIDCANDGPGTHIVSLDTLVEIQQLHAAAKMTSGWAIEQVQHPDDTLIWVGGVQMPNQSDTEEKWMTVTGQSLPNAWAAGEANDYALTPGVEDDEEQLLALWLEQTYVADIIPDYDFGVICECDGLSPDAAFIAAFEAQD